MCTAFVTNVREAVKIAMFEAPWRHSMVACPPQHELQFNSEARTLNFRKSASNELEISKIDTPGCSGNEIGLHSQTPMSMQRAHEYCCAPRLRLSLDSQAQRPSREDGTKLEQVRTRNRRSASREVSSRYECSEKRKSVTSDFDPNYQLRHEEDMLLQHGNINPHSQ